MFTYDLQLVLPFYGEVGSFQQRVYCLQSLQYLLSDPSQTGLCSSYGSQLFTCAQK
jgi:hypothetical protein